MSLPMTIKVWEDASITDRNELLIMLALADCHNPKYGCFPDLQARRAEGASRCHVKLRSLSLPMRVPCESPSDFSFSSDGNSFGTSRANS
jgi:hypothetical protein